MKEGLPPLGGGLALRHLAQGNGLVLHKYNSTYSSFNLGNGHREFYSPSHLKYPYESLSMNEIDFSSKLHENEVSCSQTA